MAAENRWAALVAAWLPATRTAGLVGARDTKGRTLSALGPDLDRSVAPEVRRRVLELLAELPEGATAAPDALLARLRWERPQRGAAGADELRARLVRWTLDEAELLGVTGRGALTSYARELLAGQNARRTAAEVSAGAARAAGHLAGLLPEPLDHVLLQADLTAVAPGPLRTPLAEFLGVAADIESKGGATVYRFTPDSVRRALDAGRTADDLHTFLATHSRTPVPQPLSLSDRRRGTAPRPPAGRRRVLVPALRRRRAARGDPGRPAGGRARPAAAGADRAGRPVGAGGGAGTAAGDGLRTGRGVRRR